MAQVWLVKRLTDSSKLALVNLLVTGILYVAALGGHGDLLLAWLLAFVTPLALITLFFAARELLMRKKVLQPVLALGASALPLLLLRGIRL